MTAISSSTRLMLAQQALAESDADLLLVTPSSDLRYLIGYAGHVSERPTLLVVPAGGDPFVLIAGFEASGLAGVDGLNVVPYGETEDPYVTLRDVVRSPVRRAVVNDQAWAIVLLRLQATFPDASFGSASPLLGAMRMRKRPDEIDLLRKAGAMADAAFDVLG